jgi:hypothetical protein
LLTARPRRAALRRQAGIAGVNAAAAGLVVAACVMLTFSAVHCPADAAVVVLVAGLNSVRNCRVSRDVGLPVSSSSSGDAALARSRFVRRARLFPGVAGGPRRAPPRDTARRRAGTPRAPRLASPVLKRAMISSDPPSPPAPPRARGWCGGVELLRPRRRRTHEVLGVPAPASVAAGGVLGAVFAAIDVGRQAYN